eukprot:scaffold16082_cov21-Tisochrysis_lutea.AAC.1
MISRLACIAFKLRPRPYNFAVPGKVASFAAWSCYRACEESLYLQKPVQWASSAGGGAKA